MYALNSTLSTWLHGYIAMISTSTLGNKQIRVSILRQAGWWIGIDSWMFPCHISSPLYLQLTNEWISFISGFRSCLTRWWNTRCSDGHILRNDILGVYLRDRQSFDTRFWWEWVLIGPPLSTFIDHYAILKNCVNGLNSNDPVMLALKRWLVFENDVYSL